MKESLGPDAIVLSNRQVDGGVEILALPPEAAAALASAHDPPPSQQPQPSAGAGDDDFRVSLSASVDKRFKPGIEPQPWKPRRIDAANAASAKAVAARGASVAARYLDEEAQPEAGRSGRPPRANPCVRCVQAQAAIDGAAESARMMADLSVR